MNHRYTDRISESHNRSVHDIGGPNPTYVRTDVTDVESSYLRDLSYESNARKIRSDSASLAANRAARFAAAA